MNAQTNNNTNAAPRARAAVARAAQTMVCEILEPRRLMSGDVMNIYGTDGPDKIEISMYVGQGIRHFTWFVNGVKHTDPDGIFTYTCNIYGKGGDDEITLLSADHGTTFRLFGDGGNDTLNFAASWGEIRPKCEAWGGSGTDKVVYDREGWGLGKSEFTLDKDGLEWETDWSWQRTEIRSDVEELVVGGSNPQNQPNRGDDFFIEEIPFWRKTTISGRDGDDHFYVAGDADPDIQGDTSGYLDKIQGKLTLLGNTGTDTVLFDDHADGGNDSYQFLSTMFSKPGLMDDAVSFYAENVTLLGNTGSNTVKVLSINSGTKVLAINAGKGGDTIELGSGDLDNSLGQTQLIVNGDTKAGDGYIDTLVLKDQYDAGVTKYEYTNTTLARAGIKTVQFANGTMDRLKILAGAGNTKFEKVPWTTLDKIALYVDAGAGDDSVFGGSGNDTIYGGYGKDTLIGDGGHDWFDGGEGADIFSGGAGSDTVSYESRTTGLKIDLNTTADDGVAGENDSIGWEVETIKGGSGWDVITLHQGIAGAAYGGGGNDTLVGSDYADTLDSGSGVDSLVGNAGNDGLFIKGSAGSTAKGGEGNDQIWVQTAAGIKVEGNGGNDFINGGSGNDTILCGSGNDQAYGGLGNDSINGDSGADLLEGNAGHDTVSGGSDNDTLTGHAGSDVLLGGTGNDKLFANDGYGVDQLNGGDGDDELFRETYDTVLGW